MSSFLAIVFIGAGFVAVYSLWWEKPAEMNGSRFLIFAVGAALILGGVALAPR